MFDDRPVENATVVLIRIENVGRAPVLATDFEQQISLTFEHGARALTAGTQPEEPEHLPVEAKVDGRSVALTPCLLNPRDSFICRVLVEGSKGKYTAIARVVGVPRLETERRSAPWPSLFLFAGTGLVVLVATAVVPLAEQSPPDSAVRAILAVLAISAGMTVPVVAQIMRRRQKGTIRERVIFLHDEDT